jgi:hypothetical protein
MAAEPPIAWFEREKETMTQKQFEVAVGLELRTP